MLKAHKIRLNSLEQANQPLTGFSKFLPIAKASGFLLRVW